MQYGPNKKVILSYRSIGKSKIADDFTIWETIRDPNYLHLIIAANSEEAIKSATYIKNMLKGSVLCTHVRPGKNPIDDRNSVKAFTVNNASNAAAPTYQAVGIFGAIDGRRAMGVLFDDVEIRKNIQTPQSRILLSEAVTAGADVLKANRDPNAGKITYLGTPHSIDSLYNKLEERGYEIRIWPAFYPTKEKMKHYANLAPMLIKDMEDNPELQKPKNGIDQSYGELTDPERHSNESLSDKMLEKGKTGFEMQYMLNTRLSDELKFPLKFNDLIVDDLDPNKAYGQYMWSKDNKYIIEDNDLPNLGISEDYFHRPSWKSEEVFEYEGCLMTIDSAGFGKDELAYSITKMLNGNVFLFESGGFSSPTTENVEKLAKRAKKHGVQNVLIESNSSGSTFAVLFKEKALPIHSCTVIEKFSSQKKEERMVGLLEPLMNAHKLIVDKNAIHYDFETTTKGLEKDPNVYSLFYQMSRLTTEKGSITHDDRLDALAMAVEYWLEWIGRDAKEAEQHKLDEIEDEELERFINSGHHISLYGEEIKTESEHSWINDDLDTGFDFDDFNML